MSIREFVSDLFRKQAPPPSIPHPTTAARFRFLRNSGFEDGFDFGKKTGAGLGASVVMAPVQWVQRAIVEPPVHVEKMIAEKEWEAEPAHPLSQLLANPNPFYSGEHLWAATVLSYLIDGNAYWLSVPNGVGQPIQLWYVPHWLIRPVGPQDGSAFLTHYEYTVNGMTFIVQPENVVHFRHGLDPNELRKGISPLQSALCEIWTDVEASQFIANILKNSGVPGLLVTPGGDMLMPGAEDTEEMKQYITERTTGQHRGEPVIMSGDTKIQVLAWDPNQMNLTAATDRSEERVCALLGIPAAVVGFSAGLETTKVGATMAEMRRLAWWNGIIPLQSVYAGTLNRQLLPQFRESDKRRVAFDNSEVAALQEDFNKVHERANTGVAGGWMTVASAKLMVGQEPLVGDEVYLRRIAIQEVPANGSGANPNDEGKGLKAISYKQDAADVIERRVAETSRREDATDAQTAYMATQEKLASVLEDKMHAELVKFFADLGDTAEAVALPILREALKLAREDVITAGRIQDGMQMEEAAPLMVAIFETHYLLVAEESTAEAMATIGLATGIPDPVAQAIQATGGTRAGLVDLSKQTRAALFKAIEEGRAEGLGADALARRIKDLVEAGPWSSSKVRAQVIARTETKHAQRMSTLIMSAEQNVLEFRVFDARLGLTDPECESLDGTIVDARTADELAGAEHPNGTRDFVPHFG